MQPDTIIPRLTNPQAWNRYSYTLNNPIRYNDPSGHKACDGKGGNDNCETTLSIKQELLRNYGVHLKGKWDNNHQLAVLDAVEKVGAKFSIKRGKNETVGEAFKSVYGYINITLDKTCYYCRKADVIKRCGDNYTGECASGGGVTLGAHTIMFATMTGERNGDLSRMTKNIVHELGHAFDNLFYDPVTKTRASDDMPDNFVKDRYDILRPNLDKNGDPCNDCLDWQQNREKSSVETFGDMFIAWTYNAWNTSDSEQTQNEIHDAQSFFDGLVK